MQQGDPSLLTVLGTSKSPFVIHRQEECVCGNNNNNNND